MNYAEMTDFEINKAVAKALGAKIVKSSFGTACFKPDFSVSELSPGGPADKFKPCNSWADAGPIIQRNHIDLESLFEFTNESEEEITPTGIWSARGVIEGHIHPRFEHANPLRAAMIVFLMMQEEK